LLKVHLCFDCEFQPIPNIGHQPTRVFQVVAPIGPHSGLEFFQIGAHIAQLVFQ